MKKYEILLGQPDEEPYHPMAIRWFLEGKGYQVTSAMGSSAAIKMLHEQHFDLVITDLLAVLEKAKELNPEMMAILMVTDKCRLIPLPNSIRRVADDYLFVPFELAELEVRVANCFEKSELRRRNPHSEAHRLGFNGDSLNMVGILAHDIRGSLLSLEATLRLLIRGYYGEMDEGVVSNLQGMLSRLLCSVGMTEECLSEMFSVHEDLEAETETLDLLLDIINPVLEELSLDSKKHCFRIERRLDAIANKEIPIKASRFWLKAVFRNLLKNALRYGREGGTIALGFEDHRSFYRLNVYNSGKPVPEECRGKLFSKFTCGNNGNGDGPSHGLGLGLYFIKMIVQKCGGEIWYEAKEDGSNFVFTLPSGVTFSVASLLPMKSKPFLMAPAGMNGTRDYVRYRRSERSSSNRALPKVAIEP